jgi:outer membrane lipoprotein-sorting protein
MRLTFVIALTLGSIALSVSHAIAADTFDPDADPVFQRIVRTNPGLKSYTAHVEVTTRVFFGHFKLRGTLYDWGPESKVVFDHVPSIAKSAVDNQPTIEAPSEWTTRYTISLVSQTADATTYRLVPRDPRGLRSIDVVADNASGLIRQYTWSNDNGLTITSDQTYRSVGGYRLIESTITRTRGRGMNAESVASFTDYDLNDPIPASIVSSN